MMNRPLVIIATAFAVGLPEISAASDDVTLNGYLDRVKSTHPFFQAELLQPEIEQEQSNRYLGWQDWRLLADGFLTHLEPLPTGPFEPERVDLVALGAGTERLFWGSGSRLTVDWVSSLTDQDLPGKAQDITKDF